MGPMYVCEIWSEKMAIVRMGDLSVVVVEVMLVIARWMKSEGGLKGKKEG